MYDRTIHWNDLPTGNIVGFGREGLVLRLNETESIKVYSPERAMFAQQAMYNAEK